MLALTGSTAAAHGDGPQPTAQPARPPTDGLTYPVPPPILADPEAPIDLAGTLPTNALPADDGAAARYDLLDATHGGNGTIPARVLRAYQQAALSLTA
nr:hypothetical protein [Micromonospora sp. DSM 115978]